MVTILLYTAAAAVFVLFVAKLFVRLLKLAVFVAAVVLLLGVTDFGGFSLCNPTLESALPTSIRATFCR